MRYLDRIGLRPKIKRYALGALFGVAVSATACAPASAAVRLDDFAEFSYSAEGCIIPSSPVSTEGRSAHLDLGDLGNKTILSKEVMGYAPGDKVQLIIERNRKYSRALNLIDRGHTKLFAELDAIEDVFKALGAKTIFTDGHIGLYDTNARTRKIGSCR